MILRGEAIGDRPTAPAYVRRGRARQRQDGVAKRDQSNKVGSAIERYA